MESSLDIRSSGRKRPAGRGQVAHSATPELGGEARPHCRSPSARSLQPRTAVAGSAPEVPRPMPRPSGQGGERRESCQEFRSRNRPETEAGEVLGFDLAVQQRHVPFVKTLAQRGDHAFGGARFEAEHRLAEEGAPKADAVEPADQAFAVPGLDRMRVTQPVQLDVGAADRRHDPGAALAAAGQLCAVGDHGLEGAIGGHDPVATAQLAAEAARQVQGVGGDHHARIGAPPQRRLARREPREDALRIRAHEPFRLQSAAPGQQAVGIAQGLLDRRKGRMRIGTQLGQTEAHPWLPSCR